MKLSVTGIVWLILSLSAMAEDVKLYVIVRQSTWSNIVEAAETKFSHYTDGTESAVFSLKWNLIQNETSNTWGYTLFSGGAWVLKRSGNPITPTKLQNYYDSLPDGVKTRLRMGFGTTAEIKEVIRALDLKKKPTAPID